MLPELLYSVFAALKVAAHEETPAPQVVTVAGGLQLEWHTNGIDLELEFEPRGRVLLVFEEDHLTGDEFDGEYASSSPEVQRAMLRLNRAV